MNKNDENEIKKIQKVLDCDYKEAKETFEQIGPLGEPDTKPKTDEEMKKIKHKKYLSFSHWLSVNGSLFALIILIVVGIICGIYNYNSNQEKEEHWFYNWDYYACEYAKKEVKNQLKSPSSAKFTSCDAMTITHSTFTYTINGTVEAQNSFGAMIKSKFTVVLEPKSKNDYSVISIDIK